MILRWYFARLKLAVLSIRAAAAERVDARAIRTVITGSVRSGTTLALRVYCPDLTSLEEQHGSAFNEPQPMSSYITSRERQRALNSLPFALRNRHRLVKSPHLSYIMDSVPPTYRLIVTFRDLRLIAASMLGHPISRQLELVESPYWAELRNLRVPADILERAIISAATAYEVIAGYRGSDIHVWNYGCWEEWEVRRQGDQRDLYRRKDETSGGVIHDVLRGKIFSSHGLDLSRWRERISDAPQPSRYYEDLVKDCHERIREAYAGRGLTVRTLEDF